MNGFRTMHSINRVWPSLTMLRSSETSASRILQLSMWGPHLHPSSILQHPMTPLVETARISSPSQHWWKDGWKLRPGFGTKTSKSSAGNEYVRSNDSVNRDDIQYTVNVKAICLHSQDKDKKCNKTFNILWLARVRRDAAIPRARGGYASSWNWDRLHACWAVNLDNMSVFNSQVSGLHSPKSDQNKTWSVWSAS